MATLADILTKDSVDRSVNVRILDDADGTPETGVVFNSAGIDMWYRREGGLLVSIVEADLASPALDDPHLDGGFLHIRDGVYRLDLPDAAFATGAEHVDFGGTVTGMVVIGGRVRLTDFDLESAAVLASQLIDDIMTEVLADGYAANGVAPTLQQAIMGIYQTLMAFAISGTTISVKQLDGITEAFQIALNDATNPTQAIRS